MAQSLDRMLAETSSATLLSLPKPMDSFHHLPRFIYLYRPSFLSIHTLLSISLTVSPLNTNFVLLISVLVNGFILKFSLILINVKFVLRDNSISEYLTSGLKPETWLKF